MVRASSSISEPSYFILAALLDGPLHGYGIIKQAAKLSDGRVRLAAGTLYGALDRLAEQGLILADRQEVVEGRTRRYYRLTDHGVRALQGRRPACNRRHASSRVGQGRPPPARGRHERAAAAPLPAAAGHLPDRLPSSAWRGDPQHAAGGGPTHPAIPLLAGVDQLAAGGLRMRALQAAKESPTRLWTDGLHLGVLLVVLVNLGSAPQLRFPLWTALVAVGALAVLRGWGRTALAATAIAALALARPLLPHIGLPWWLPGYGDWAAVGRYVWPAVVLAVLAWPGSAACGPDRGGGCCCRPPRQRFPLAEGPWSVVKAGAEVGLLLAVLVVAVGALDPRPAIAAAVYLVPGLLYAAERIAEGAPSDLALGYWMVLAVLTATLAAAAWRVRRQHLTQR
jgi:DNA-binding PadR family transcriptional regulator